MASNSPTRLDKAAPSMEVVSILAAILEQHFPYDYLVLYAIRGWGYRTAGYVTIDHMVMSLGIDEQQVLKSVNRLRRMKYVALDKESGHLSITKEGKKEFWRLKGLESEMFVRWQEASEQLRPNNLIEYNKSRQK